jgi:hypothetical protein
MARRRHRLNGLAVLLAVCVLGCGEAPTSPSDPRPQLATLSAPSSVLAAIVETRDCTFGAGYWRTHPNAWPGRFDPDAIFYTSEKSWVDVLDTQPKGDAYYILAHQFIAAGLNLDQLDPSLRPDEIGEPWAIVGPRYFTEGAHSSLTRAELITLATLFEGFNEGKRGVPPCR